MIPCARDTVEKLRGSCRLDAAADTMRMLQKRMSRENRCGGRAYERQIFACGCQYESLRSACGEAGRAGMIGAGGKMIRRTASADAVVCRKPGFAVSAHRFLKMIHAGGNIFLFDMLLC